MKNTVGSEKWFRGKAIASISKIKDGVWDYSDSSVLYTPQVSSAYGEAQKDQENAGYKKTVTDEETLFIEKIAPSIIKNLPYEFTYIDLGPGTEHKEEFFQDSILVENKKVLYIPVDISEQMLKIADEYAKDRGFKTYPVHQTFEDLNTELEQIPDSYRFVSLGLTFTNYKPEEILGILKDITGSNGSFFITVQLRERVNMSELQKVYKEVIARKMLPDKLALVGIDFEKDIVDIEVTEDVEIYAILKKVSPALEKIGIQSGDRLLLLRSYRYKLEQLKQILANHEVQYYDEGSQFIGCLIKA